MRETEGGGLHPEKIAVGRHSRLAGPLGASLTPRCPSVRGADPRGLPAEGTYPGLSVGTDLGDVRLFIHPSVLRTVLQSR